MEVLCKALLRGLCRLHGWDAKAIGEMASGRAPTTPEVATLFRRAFGVPPNAWPIPPPVVSASGARYAFHVTEADRRSILRRNGRRRRRLGTPVHDVLDRLDWSIADLARHISARLQHPVSRASVQFWAVGQRQVGPAGESRKHPVQAPLEIRIVAEKITAKEAMRRGLGETAILMRDIWPNVEPD